MTDNVAPSNFDDDNNNNNNTNQHHQHHQQQRQQGLLLSSATLTRLSETEVQDLQYAFSLLDTAGTGRIAVRQLMELLQELLLSKEEEEEEEEEEQQQQTMHSTTTTAAAAADNNNDSSSSTTTKAAASTTTTAYRYQHNLQRVIQQLALLPPDKDLTQTDFVQLITTTTTSSQQQDADDDSSSNNNNHNNNNNNNNNTLQSVFDLFSQGKPYIEVHDLQRVAAELGENLSPEELHEMMQRIASDDPTKVTLPDFCHIMNRKLFP